MLSVCRSKYTKSDLCKNQEFLESQKKGYRDPTYDYKAGYPRPDEAWAFDANGNIDKEKSAEVSEKIGEWSTYALMLVIPGPEELLITGILVKVGGKVSSKTISWGANKFGPKGAAKGVTKEAKIFNEPKGVGNPVKIEGRGSTGRTKPINLDEQMAMHQVQSNPMKGAYEIKSIEMTDKRWPIEEGWVKMQNIVTLQDKTKVNVHFVYNKITGQFDDFKFK